MAEPADLVAALVALLKADAAVAASVGARVFGGELPAGETAHMPRTVLVAKASGGVSLTGDSKAEHDTQRIDLFAYGATPHEAAGLMAAAALALRGVDRAVWAGVLLHWARPAGGFSSAREPEVDWPRQFQSWQVFHALRAVA